MNYFNELTEIESVTTTHLSTKGSEQVNDFIDFVKPLIPDIKKGEAAKAKIAQYYLDNKSEYTDGCVKVLEPLVNQLGVSPGYISQIKKAGEYKNALHDSGLRQWVDEHPVSIQYEIARIPHECVADKYMTGEHFSFREARKCKDEAKVEKVDTAAEDTVTVYQERMSAAKAMVADEGKKYIYDVNSAEVYMSSTVPGLLAAAMQKISEMSTCDEQRRRQLLHLRDLVNQAINKPAYYQTRHPFK